MPWKIITPYILVLVDHKGFHYSTRWIMTDDDDHNIDGGRIHFYWIHISQYRAYFVLYQFRRQYFKCRSMWTWAHLVFRLQTISLGKTNLHVSETLSQGGTTTWKCSGTFTGCCSFFQTAPGAYRIMKEGVSTCIL